MGGGVGGFLLVSDTQWSRGRAVAADGQRGSRGVDDRRVLSAIVHVLQNSGPLGSLSRACLWPEEDALQPLRTLGQAKYVEAPSTRLPVRKGGRISCLSIALHQGGHRTTDGAKREGLANGIDQTAAAEHQGPRSLRHQRPSALRMITPSKVHDTRAARGCIAALCRTGW